MCKVQDVYHSACGHWADRPRIEHKCAAARQRRSSRSGMHMTSACTNPKVDGFFEDRKNKCPTCTKNLDDVCEKAGTWLSCGIDKATGKPYFRERKPESEASFRARTRATKREQMQPPPVPTPAKRQRTATEGLKQPPKQRKDFKLDDIPKKTRPEPKFATPSPLTPGAEYWWKKSREEDERKSSACSWSSHGHVEL